MFLFEIATLPTRTQPQSTVIARGSSPSVQIARGAAANKLMSQMSPQAAHRVASQISESWTDFPEHGITARISVMPKHQCIHRSAEGKRCQRTVSAVAGFDKILCWQHS